LNQGFLKGVQKALALLIFIPPSLTQSCNIYSMDVPQSGQPSVVIGVAPFGMVGRKRTGEKGNTKIKIWLKALVKGTPSIADPILLPQTYLGPQESSILSEHVCT
jgi:hypothetical protein